MHIMEGFLPVEHALGWTVVASPFVVWGAIRAKKIMSTDTRSKLLLAAAGAFLFLLTALKLPSVPGSCSHPTGVALGVFLFGPVPMALLGVVVLLFQALLLAHGGITTLGANVVSLAVVGPWVAWGIWKLCQRLGLKLLWSSLLATFIGAMATYLFTAFELALAYPAPKGGFGSALLKFCGVFTVIQVPVSVIEALLTAAFLVALIKLGRMEGTLSPKGGAL